MTTLKLLGALLAALPFGWAIGVFAAYAIAGPDFGQLPVVTVPICIAAALVFALVPVLSAGTRLRIMLGGTAAFVVFGLLAA
jgi:hypothetical protein